MATFTIFILLIAATLRVATPLILAAFGGLFSERSGIIALGLEGMLLGACFASASVSAVTGSAWLGLGAGVAAAMLLALLLAFACVTQRGDQVVAAIAVNIMVAGLGPTLALAWFDQGGQTPPLSNPAQRFLGLDWPGSRLPVHPSAGGVLYSDLLSGHSILVYLAFAFVPLASWLLYRSRWGLRLRAVGENPSAVDTAGISVDWLRYSGVLMSGALCGVAGTYMAISAGAGFVRDMTAGKGYLALAALIFGKWRPWPTLGACLLFAFTDALASRLQGVPLPVIGVVPVQFILALPYALTVLLLAGFVGKSISPRALGTPYRKEK